MVCHGAMKWPPSASVSSPTLPKVVTIPTCDAGTTVNMATPRETIATANDATAPVRGSDLLSNGTMRDIARAMTATKAKRREIRNTRRTLEFYSDQLFRRANKKVRQTGD